MRIISIFLIHAAFSYISFQLIDSLILLLLNLLADELTANLDTKSSEQIIGLLMELNKSGQTIVMVTHELELAGEAGRQDNLVEGWED